MNDPHIDVSCKIILEEVYKRYLESDRLPKYFYSLVQIAGLTIGGYIPEWYRWNAYPVYGGYEIIFAIPEVDADGNPCNLMLEFQCEFICRLIRKVKHTPHAIVGECIESLTKTAVSS